LTNLKISIKSKITLAALISIAIVLTAYTASAYYAASFVREMGGRLWWPSTPGGSFIPWPTAPTGIQGMMTYPLIEEDMQYYRCIIQSGVPVALTFLLWVTVFWKVWKIRKTQTIHT
jgi:hypothetical protein